MDFQINYQDACKSSQITAKTITLSSVKFDTSQSQSISAFQDSVDASGLYLTGICGEKLVELDPSTPNFLSVQRDSVDPVLNDFSIVYNHNLAIESDIQTHTISYSVKSVEYPSDVTTLTGSG